MGQVWSVVCGVIVSLGGGGAIVFGLSSFLGRVWADRLMARETNRHAAELERLRVSLKSESDAELEMLRARLTHELDELRTANQVNAHTHLQGRASKLEAYRQVTDVIADLLADFDAHFFQGVAVPDPQARFREFNRRRLKAYADLAMFAPLVVMGASDKLFDYLMAVANDEQSYEWAEVRRCALTMLNAMRADIGIGDEPVVYTGVR